ATAAVSSRQPSQTTMTSSTWTLRTTRLSTRPMWAASLNAGMTAAIFMFFLSRPGPSRGQRRSHLLPDESGGLLDGHPLLQAPVAAGHLHGVFGQSPRPDGDPPREPDQVRVVELDARPLQTVVQHHFHARGRKLLVQALGHLPLALVPVVHGHHDDVVGRHRRRPADAALVVVLLDDGGHRPADADAVAAH